MSSHGNHVPVLLTRDGLTIRALLDAHGTVHAGRTSGLVSAWERRGWTVTVTQP